MRANDAGDLACGCLQNASNTISNLGDVTASSFALEDNTDLTVFGTVNGGTNATITDAGGVLAISGTVSAGAIALAGLTLNITGETTDSDPGAAVLLRCQQPHPFWKGDTWGYPAVRDVGD